MPSNSRSGYIQREKLRISKTFGTFDELFAKFSPNNMSSLNDGYEDAYASDAPTLTYVDLTYGQGSAIVWLAPYISMAFGICGFLKEQVTDFMVESTARSILRSYYYLKLPELSLFFSLFIAGKFNMFHGCPNPQVITSSLSLFCKERAYYVSMVENKRSMERSLEKTQDAITYDEFVARQKAKGKDVNFVFENGTYKTKENNEKG